MKEAIAGLEVPVASWRTNLTSQVLRSSLLGDDKAHCMLGVARLLMWDAGLMMMPSMLMVPSLLELSHRRWDVGGLLLLLMVGWLVRHTFLEQKRSTTDLLHPIKGLYMCENTYLRCEVPLIQMLTMWRNTPQNTGGKEKKFQTIAQCG